MQSRPQDRPLALSAGKSHSPTNGREERVYSGEGFYLRFLIFDPFLIFLSSIVLMTREGHNHSSPLYHNHNRGLWFQNAQWLHWKAAIFQFFPFLLTCHTIIDLHPGLRMRVVQGYSFVLIIQQESAAAAVSSCERIWSGLPGQWCGDVWADCRVIVSLSLFSCVHFLVL